MKEKFYEKTWFTILTLICVFPVGLILMWKNKKFNIPTRIVITILGVFIIFCIMGGSKGSTENNNTKQTIAITTTEANVNEEQSEITIAKPNTSSKVDEISIQAKNDAKNIDDGKTIEAINFIKENYPNYFESNEVMEKTMYYGYLLEYGYKNKNNNYADLGMDAYQVVKYVYRGAEKVEDISTQENLKQIVKDLAGIK